MLHVYLGETNLCEIYVSEKEEVRTLYLLSFCLSVLLSSAFIDFNLLLTF